MKFTNSRAGAVSNSSTDESGFRMYDILKFSSELTELFNKTKWLQHVILYSFIFIEKKLIYMRVQNAIKIMFLFLF